MAARKKKWVVFKNNTTIPAVVLGEDKDQKVQVGEAVQVPGEYADHVVQDGFADYSDVSAKASPKKSNDEAGVLQAKIRKLEKALEGANGELSKAEKENSSLKEQLNLSVEHAQRFEAELLEKDRMLQLAEGLLAEAAQTAVTDAQAALDAAEDTDAAEDARVALVAAQDALAALQA